MTKKHNERCRDCKTRVEELLERLYGEVLTNHNLNLPSHVEDYTGSAYENDLIKIHTALQEYRGHKVFVRSKRLPNVDYFIPSQGFVVEFDESQHFTKPREISLSNYPESLETGFNISKWREMCEDLNKRDNDPPFRDEQRAWYDTLRDVAPAILDLKPTVRLFASDVVWCSLDPNSNKDLQSFSQILMGE